MHCYIMFVFIFQKENIRKRIFDVPETCMVYYLSYSMCQCKSQNEYCSHENVYASDVLC